MDRSTLMNATMGLLAVFATAELLYALVARRGVHTFRDTLSSLGLGIGQQAINIYLSATFLGLFALVHERFALVSLDMQTWWHWLLFVPACDLSYYVAHRAMHTINFWVAAHIVHHQAEDYNHLSAMRQSWTAWIVNFPFFVWLALFVPLEMFVVGQLGIMFLQFLSHNGLYMGKLGILDRIFVTPANHRVHHGINGPYLGANCGGMFVLWDRVFGTFVEEDPDIPIEMGAGLKVPFYDPFEANLDYYRRVWFVMRHRRGLGHRLAIWLQSPETLFAELEALDYERHHPPREVERGPLSPSDKALAGGALLASVAALAWHRGGFADHSLLVQLISGAVVLGAVGVLGHVLSRPAPPQESLGGRSDVLAK